MAKTQSVADIFNALSDDEALELFRSIAVTNGDSDMLKSKTSLTRKQYYSRLSKMIKSGLVKRKNGKHILTAFGRVVFDTQKTLNSALDSYWKLKAIDSLDLSDELPQEERRKLIESLIENPELKEILVKET